MSMIDVTCTIDHGSMHAQTRYAWVYKCLVSHSIHICSKYKDNLKLATCRYRFPTYSVWLYYIVVPQDPYTITGTSGLTDNLPHVYHWSLWTYRKPTAYGTYTREEFDTKCSNVENMSDKCAIEETYQFWHPRTTSWRTIKLKEK